MFFQEYSLIMSERDSVHKEIEKLQDEVQETKRKMNLAEGRTKLQDDEVVFFFSIGLVTIHCNISRIKCRQMQISNF